MYLYSCVLKKNLEEYNVSNIDPSVDLEKYSETQITFDVL